jgi:histidinol-phosphate aminotransferase
MSNFDELVPEHIRALHAYTPGKPVKQAEAESGVQCIKMASNENPFGPSPLALKAMRQAAASLNFYPDNDATELRYKLAEMHHLQPEQVLVTAGTTALLGIAARTLLAPGLNAVTSQRSFIVYPIATQAAGGRLIQVPMKNDTFDLDAILKAMDAKTRIVYIANPNNPTGTLVDAPAVDRFLARVPAHVLVILDEAYCNFAEPAAKAAGIEYTRSLEYVRQGRQVLVLRTFSKAHGLAGARIGYGMGPASLLNYFARVRTAFSISDVAQAGAMAALDDQTHICKTVENNAAGAKYLIDEITELGFRVLPTFANFLYIELGEDSVAIGKRFEAEGVIIRPLTVWGAPTAIRVTIGTPEQNRRFIAALKKVMARETVAK